MTVEPYVSFHGRILSNLVHADEISMSGGGRKIDSYSGPGREDADISETGRNHVTYKFEMLSLTRADLEAAISDLNTAPEDAELYPFSNDRCVYASQAYAVRSRAKPVSGPDVLCYADATIAASDGRLLGPDQGEGLLLSQAMPFSDTFTNAGYYENTIDYLYVSGGYDAMNGLTRELLLTCGDYVIPLCDQLMWKDSFKLDRFGNVKHRKETGFPMVYSSLQSALGGSGFVNYGTGGSITYQAFHMANSGKLLFPFYGPLPIRSTPYLEIVLSSMVGSPKIQVAYDAELSDIEDVPNVTLKAGTNRIYLPDAEGEDLIVFGITTDDSASVTVEYVLAEVQRYIAEDELPLIEIGDEATFVVSDGEYSNHQIEAINLVYRDLF